MNLTEYIDHCMSYNGMADAGLQRRDKAVQLFVEQFGFKVINMSRNFIQLVKDVAGDIHWVQFNYEVCGEFWYDNGDERQLERLLSTARVIEDSPQFIVVEQRLYRFELGKRDHIVSIYRKDSPNMELVECLVTDVPSNEHRPFLNLCKEWVKTNDAGNVDR